MKTVLLLEDEPSVLKLMGHWLRSYSLIQAATAEQAIEFSGDCDRKIDLLVADVRLPTRSGIQVALQLRSDIPALPVILISGYPVSGWRDQEATDLERLGSCLVTILSKPFQGQTLSNAVCELIGAPQFAKARTA
jgi:two-component system, chemotaxis family, chemotaxis protein CheY